MNQRIQQLAEQAKASVPAGTLSVDQWIETYNQALAELVIKECLQQCERVRNDAATQKNSEFLTNDGKMLYEGVYGGATNCGFAIQQHFGVDE